MTKKEEDIVNLLLLFALTTHCKTPTIRDREIFEEFDINYDIATDYLGEGLIILTGDSTLNDDIITFMDRFKVILKRLEKDGY